MKDMVCSFGSRLRTHRLMVGRTLQEVTDASGCTKAYLSQVERTDNEGRISAGRAYAIAQFLGVPMAAFMGESPGEPASAEDMTFFHRYVALSEQNKARFQKVCQLMRGRS
ncbi:MAG: helix-turn-helix domain-containing protein [Azoarcus sp.]|jgi:transcriptional regulator with XRE-family HTH domain|nr:helix-turn-helix domain-containing protein [Azoarcus sp.]